ncbi:MAG TPA: S8 family serine peptidase [Solirubrobacteraceae bacterium]
MSDGANGGADLSGGAPLSDMAAEYTGRFVVVFSDEVADDAGASTAALRSVAEVSNIASSLDFKEGAVDLEQTESADATIFAKLGVAVVSADPTRGAAIAALAESDSRILVVEPERILHAIAERPGSLEYARGYRDGVSGLYEQLAGGGSGNGAVDPAVASSFADTASFTWGLQATLASGSTRTGAGISVAVLDTGFDLNHPDFVGRPIISQSFVPGQAVQDLHGHGTHCVGTSCGPKDSPGPSRRYGVATLAKIFVGKVLSNQGSGSDSQILAGMNWALTNNVQVISMSLGANVPQVSQAYETVGQRALQAGALIVAAAGNNADRSAGNVGFVGMPANSPSIMAVGAIDSNLGIANFSARSGAVAGGKVDIAGPGVAVHSSWPIPTRYRSISGTSMATPHVAGVAALVSQATGTRGQALWNKVIQTTRPLTLPSADVGAGLVQAPL